jgi:hypothetical protein
MRTSSLCFAALVASVVAAQQCPSAVTIDAKPQVFIMSDISNEPDDTMSFIRLLLHSDQYNVTGMVAVTSYWLNSSVYPDQILNTTHAFGQVVDNLNIHSAGGFPTSEYLSSVVKAGQPIYGTAALGLANISSGALYLISVVDGLAADDILHVQCWAGVNLLGEALFYVQRTRVPYEFSRFINKLRIYSISDQDNVGPWIRENFPTIPYIVSLHGFNEYGKAAWVGISGEKYYNFDHGGPDSSLVDNQYVKTHFQLGPLGSHYPNIAYIMEGDSPSILHTMMNGLNGGPYDQPEWGGWGGRYRLQDWTRQTMLYNDARDSVVGMNNYTFLSSQASIWRWRQAYQDEMSARVQWSIQSNYSNCSHPPVVVVNGSCGSGPIMWDVYPDQVVTFDASGTYDPDANISVRNPLQYNWFHYPEPGANIAIPAQADSPLNFTTSEGGKIAQTTMPNSTLVCPPGGACQQYHVILEVTGSGTPPIRRYRRVILKAQLPAGDASASKRKRDEL